MKAKHKMYVTRLDETYKNFITSAYGTIAGRTSDFIWYSFSDYDYEIKWSIFASNPEYIKIRGGLE